MLSDPRHDALPAAEVDIQGIHGTTSSHRSSGTSAEAGEQSSRSDSSASSAVQRAVSMRVLRPRRIRTSKAGKKGSAYTSSDHHIWLNGTAKLRWDRLKRGRTRAPSGAATAGDAEAPKRRSKLAYKRVPLPLGYLTDQLGPSGGHHSKEAACGVHLVTRLHAFPASCGLCRGQLDTTGYLWECCV